MISAQTLRVCREGKPVPTFPDHALGRLTAPLFDPELFTKHSNSGGEGGLRSGA
jgi:hypothetical protein